MALADVRSFGKIPLEKGKFKMFAKGIENSFYIVLR